LVLVAIAGVTDWFDGYTARLLGVTGKLGVILDPLADKAMLVTLFLALGYLSVVPLWMLALAIGRDLVIVSGALLLRIFRNRRRFKPSTLGKISTFFQITFVLLVLIHAAAPDLRPLLWLEDLALALTGIFTAISGLDYIRIGVSMARQPAVADESNPDLRKF
jgi:cardiolipin synthase